MSDRPIDEEIEGLGSPAAAPESLEAVPVRRMDFGFLKARTGEGPVESYLDHPLNFTSSKAMAHTIRGMTGMLGALDLAVVDIGVGLMHWFKDRKKVGTG